MTKIHDSVHFQTVNAVFPNIGRKIQVFWGYPEFVALMGDLQHDTSDKPRAGFPGDVLMALHYLEAEHDRQFPQHVKKDTGIWNLGKP